MGRLLVLFEKLATWPAGARFLVVFAAVLFAGSNLPWHLDNYDQAKQAWVSYEMAQGGDLLYQHTPRGAIATKPPLVGWLSLGVFRLTGWWDLAWRLPSIAAAVVLLGLIMREGGRLWPEGGAWLAGAAFTLNMLTPRLASLVRTDMLLALFIGICGILILRKVATGKPWTFLERLAFAAAMTASLLTKGPVLYAFLAPGMVAYALLAPRGRRALVWSGAWTWLLPLAVFLAWGIGGLLTRPEFYQEIVVEEFFSRFNQDLKSHERQQPIWFYLPHLLHKFLPWSLLAIGLLAVSANVRRALRGDPAALWLACWAVGGIVLMTLVPSKRVDRIYPVIVPLAMLLPAMVAACQCGVRVRRWCGACLVAAGVFTTAYFVAVVVIGYRDDYHGLKRFARDAAVMAAPAGLPGIVSGRDEGLAMYAGSNGFLKPREAVARWKAGTLRALIVPERRLNEDSFADWQARPPVALSSGRRPSGETYLLFIAPATQPEPQAGD